ncbi:MAG: anti-sigma factor family protein [Paracoccaceae bacterium]
MTQTEIVSDDMLMALADGELMDADARRLRTRIEADPDLMERFAVFAETRAVLQAAFPPEPVPQRLVQAVLAEPEAMSATVLPFARRPKMVMPAWGMALAASLVLAVGAAGFLVGQRAAPVLVAMGPEAAAVALATTPTGGEVTLSDGSVARALASYQTDLGLCRLIGTDSTRAVVCRSEAPAEAGWVVALSVTAAQDESYLPASDLGTALIDQLLDDIGASAPLDGTAETQVLAQ